MKVSFTGDYKSYKAERQKELNQKLEDGMKRLGFTIERDAKVGYDAAGITRQTGRSRSSISTNWTGSGMTRGKVESPATANDGVSQPSGKGFEVVVGSNVDYIGFLEFGTSKRPARPFLFPALEKNRDKIKELLKG